MYPESLPKLRIVFNAAEKCSILQLAEWGAAGVGQSSWGPTVYGIVEGADAAARLAERVKTALGSSGQVFEGPFRAEGARVWKT